MLHLLLSVVPIAQGGNFSTNGTNLQYMTMFGWNATAMRGWNNIGISEKIDELEAAHNASGGVLRGVVQLKGRKIFDETSGGVKGLMPDWQSNWAAMLNEMTPGLKSGALQGVMMIDEASNWGCQASSAPTPVHPHNFAPTLAVTVRPT